MKEDVGTSSSIRMKEKISSHMKNNPLAHNGSNVEPNTSMQNGGGEELPSTRNVNSEALYLKEYLLLETQHKRKKLPHKIFQGPTLI